MILNGFWNYFPKVKFFKGKTQKQDDKKENR